MEKPGPSTTAQAPPAPTSFPRVRPKEAWEILRAAGEGRGRVRDNPRQAWHPNTPTSEKDCQLFASFSARPRSPYGRRFRDGHDLTWKAVAVTFKRTRGQPDENPPPRIIANYRAFKAPQRIRRYNTLARGPYRQRVGPPSHTTDCSLGLRATKGYRSHAAAIAALIAITRRRRRGATSGGVIAESAFRIATTTGSRRTTAWGHKR